MYPFILKLYYIIFKLPEPMILDFPASDIGLAHQLNVTSIHHSISIFRHFDFDDRIVQNCNETNQKSQKGIEKALEYSDVRYRSATFGKWRSIVWSIETIPEKRREFRTQLIGVFLKMRANIQGFQRTSIADGRHFHRFRKF